MKAFFALSLSLLLVAGSANARVVTLYPEAEPCEPSPFGTFCQINPKMKPYHSYRHPIYCGDSLVYVTHRQKRVLDAMLRENRNVVLKVKFDNEFVDAPCF